MTFERHIETPALSIPTGEIARVLLVLRHAVGRSPKLPILQTVRLTARRGASQMRVGATDLDTEVAVRIEATARRDTDICIPARALAALSRGGGEEISLSPEGDRLHLASGGVEGWLRPAAGPGEFPEFAWPGVSGAPVLHIPEGALHRLLRLCRHCVSTESTRYYLHGIFLTAHPTRGTLRAVATDGHRLAVADDDTPVPESWTGGIVPTRAADALLAMTAKTGNALVSLNAGGRAIRAVRDGMTVTAKTIDGTFPDYTRIVPTDEGYDNRAVLALSAVAGLTRAFAAMSGARRGPTFARLDPAAGRMIVADPDTEVATPATMAGDTAIGFNARYLTDQARVTPTMRIRWRDDRDPAFIEAADEMERAGQAAFWLLMPARV